MFMYDLAFEADIDVGHLIQELKIAGIACQSTPVIAHMHDIQQ